MSTIVIGGGLAGRRSLLVSSGEPSTRLSHDELVDVKCRSNVGDRPIAPAHSPVGAIRELSWFWAASPRLGSSENAQGPATAHVARSDA
jgi:hypothetical protein